MRATKAVMRTGAQEPLLRGRSMAPLLDRLVDDDPEQPCDAVDHRTCTGSALRAAVVRDLEALFNACAPLHQPGDDLLACAVTHFGLPPLAGRPASGLDAPEIASLLRRAILRFESRILPAALHVTPEPAALHTPNVLRLRIEARLQAKPVPLEIVLRTRIDLDGGQVRVVDEAGP